MKKMLIASLVAFAAMALYAQGSISGLGDKDLENAVREMNRLGAENPGAFYAELELRFGLASGEANRFAQRNRLSPGECYLVAELARERTMTMAQVMAARRSRAGWAETLRGLGLSAGSAELSALSRSASGDLLRVQDRMQTGTTDQTRVQLQTRDQDRLGSDGSGGGSSGSGSGSSGGSSGGGRK